jgi:hypothetical protein
MANTQDYAYVIPGNRTQAEISLEEGNVDCKVFGFPDGFQPDCSLIHEYGSQCPGYGNSEKCNSNNNCQWNIKDNACYIKPMYCTKAIGCIWDEKNEKCNFGSNKATQLSYYNGANTKGKLTCSETSDINDSSTLSFQCYDESGNQAECCPTHYDKIVGKNASVATKSDLISPDNEGTPQCYGYYKPPAPPSPTPPPPPKTYWYCDRNKLTDGPQSKSLTDDEYYGFCFKNNTGCEGQKTEATCKDYDDNCEWVKSELGLKRTNFCRTNRNSTKYRCHDTAGQCELAEMCAPLILSDGDPTSNDDADKVIIDPRDLVGNDGKGACYNLNDDLRILSSSYNNDPDSYTIYETKLKSGTTCDLNYAQIPPWLKLNVQHFGPEFWSLYQNPCNSTVYDTSSYWNPGTTDSDPDYWITHTQGVNEKIYQKVQPGETNEYGGCAFNIEMSPVCYSDQITKTLPSGKTLCTCRGDSTCQFNSGDSSPWCFISNEAVGDDPPECVGVMNDTPQKSKDPKHSGQWWARCSGGRVVPNDWPWRSCYGDGPQSCNSSTYACNNYCRNRKQSDNNPVCWDLYDVYGNKTGNPGQCWDAPKSCSNWGVGTYSIYDNI